MLKGKCFTFKKLLFAGSAVVLFGLGVGTLTILYFINQLPSPEYITSREVAQSTKIYDRTGKVLLYEISDAAKRTVIPLENIPLALRDATIAIEDQRFYSEPGVSVRGILRAFVANLQSGGVVQGGSTITQQLAKNAFLTPERTIARKIKEVLLAVKFNQQYTKDKILELYFNEVSYGPNIQGVEAASQSYFGKPAHELTLAESAILAALPKAPTRLWPYGNHTDELFRRQHLILNKMHELGAISDAALTDALNEKVVFSPQTAGIRAPHFVIGVQEYLVDRYGEDLVRRGGLSVITTLDWELQQLAEEVVAHGTERNAELYGGTNGALVAQDAKTGAILALVGSRDFFDIEHEGNFNVATQGLRQPGSALKPFVYFTAFEKGYTPETIVFDTPTEFVPNNPNCPAVPDFTSDNHERACFHPENFDGVFRGPVSFRQALAQSINVPAVKVLYLAGLGDTLEVLGRFGITTLTDPSRYGLSLVLGGGEVKLAELVSAYAILAREGMRYTQHTILEVRDARGAILEVAPDGGEEVSGPESPRRINDILSDLDLRAGLFQNSLPLTVFPGHDVALKTGTTNDYRDAWAIGYTPTIVVGVWAGNNDNTPMHQQGSSILAAVPMWHEFMKEALAHVPFEPFTPPPPSTAKNPRLLGEYIEDGETHSILYAVDKNNPTSGTLPENALRDPQFTNWEIGVLGWVHEHLPDLYSKSLQGIAARGSDASAFSSLTAPHISISSPQQGAFFTNTLVVEGHIEAATPITEVAMFFNNAPLEILQDMNTTSYVFRWVVSPKDPQPQNVVRVRATDTNGNAAEQEVIIYYN